MDNCITCKKQNKGNNWRNCKLKCHYKYEQRKKDEIYKLQEENEKQKEQIKQLEDFIKSAGEIDHINHEYTYKLKQTLQEIKKIAERQLFVTNVRTYQMVYYADFSEYRNEILEKITKAEEE